MKIFQRLFKIAKEQRAHQNTTTKDREDKPKDIAKACFYRSIYLIKSKLFQKKVISSRKTDNQPHSQSIMKIKKKCQKSDSSKVLPLSVSPSSSNSSNEKKDNTLKGDNKTKPMSRMKELLRRAAASTKSKKREKLSQKVMNLKACGALTAVSSGDDRLSSNLESPKFSFSSNFSSSPISGISMASSLRNDEACSVIALNASLIHGLDRCSSMRGNWITTDSEFVVLELSG